MVPSPGTETMAKLSWVAGGEGWTGLPWSRRSAAGRGKEEEEVGCSSSSLLVFWDCPSNTGAGEGWRRNPLQNRSMKTVLFKGLVLYDLLTVQFGNFNELFHQPLCFLKNRRGRGNQEGGNSLCVAFKNIVFTITTFCHELPSRSQNCHAKIFHIY